LMESLSFEPLLMESLSFGSTAPAATLSTAVSDSAITALDPINVRLADPAVLTESDVVIMSVRVTCRSVVGRRGSYGLCQISGRLGGAGVTYSSDELWAAIVIFLARGSRSIGAPRAEQISHARQIVTTKPAGTAVGHRPARQERIGPPVAGVGGTGRG